MKRIIQLPVLTILCFLLIWGCAGKTKPYIPKNIKGLSDGFARIVVTRESQLAGATTPIYILDLGLTKHKNAQMAYRVGSYVKDGYNTLYISADGMDYNFVKNHIHVFWDLHFEEKNISIDEVIEHNIEALIYVTSLWCDPDKLPSIYCGVGKDRCDQSFKQSLIASQGKILVGASNINNPNINNTKMRDIQLIGRIMVGDTLIWDREPGIIRIGALWGAFNGIDDNIALLRGNINVKPGKTYYFHFTTRMKGERWEVTKIE